MVQRPIQQGDFSSFQRDVTSWNRNERSFLDTPQDNRFPRTATSVHHHGDLTIEQALRDCVPLPGLKEFGLIVTFDNGEEKTYTSKSLTPLHDRVFNDRFRSDFRKAVRRATDDPYCSSGFSEFDLDSGRDRNGSASSGRSKYRKNRSEDSEEEATSSSSRSKRPRYPGQYRRHHSNDDTPIPVPVVKFQEMEIGNEEEVEKFYGVRFKDMQQSACKVMGKAFVKLVEPKKQTHHPYTKGDEKAPAWWPPTAGADNVKVRHKEPDHLLKPERIRLLVHILRMIVKPNHEQHPSIRKLELNVKKLEEVTMEAMSNWFNDKDHLENAQKRPFLKEIFKVAKNDERYRNGEIDGTTTIPVMYGERAGSGDGDGSDDEGDEHFKPEDDEEQEMPISSSSLPTPDSIVSPAIGHNRHNHSEQDQNTLGLRPLVHRHNTQPMDDYSEHPVFFSSRGLGVNFQQQPRSPGLQDPVRNQFVSPQSSFNSPQMFWPPMVSSASNGNNFYVTSPQTSMPPVSTYHSLPLPSTQQNMLPPPVSSHSTFDGLPARPFDSTPAIGTQFRTGSIGHPHQMPQHHQGFQEYLQENGSFGHHVSELKEDQHMHPS